MQAVKINKKKKKKQSLNLSPNPSSELNLANVQIWSIAAYMMLAESYLSYPLKKEKEGVLLDIKFEKKFS